MARASKDTDQSFQCNVCGGNQIANAVARADGAEVVYCATCGMGTIHPVPDSLIEYYLGDYYSAGVGAASGYEDYEGTAEHGVAWAAAILQALDLQGTIIDIGCANGHLLKKVCPPMRAFGIELNPKAALEARAAGVSVVAADLFDPATMERYADYFDVVTSIATFEHLRDFRGGVEQALRLLKKDGVLLFEVPLISAIRDNTIWYTSSLEHVYYPTLEAIERLFGDYVGAPMVGTELWIVSYASTYIGIAARDESVLSRHRPTWERIVGAEVTPANTMERRARALLHLIHAANRATSSVELLADLTDADLNRALLKRITALWCQDAVRADSLSRERDSSGRAS